MIRRVASVIAASTLVIGACGGDGAAEPDGTASIPIVDSTDGKELFERTVLVNTGGCITCHSLTPGKVLVGPSVADIGAVAGDRVGGMSARDYLLESIVDPDAFVVEGFEAGRMPANWEQGLSPAAVSALVDYMLTLGTG